MMNVKNDIKNLRLLDVEQHMADNVKKNKISKEAIELYNKALEKAKRDGEDIAIIELKRALTFNENFVEALTLLGYCYLIIDNQVDAKKYLFRATQLSEYGIRAYMLLHGMGVLDTPEEIISRNNLEKYNGGTSISNNTKKKLKARNDWKDWKDEKDGKDGKDGKDKTAGVSIHAVGFAGRSRKSWIIPVLLVLAILFAIMYLLFLR